MPAAGIAIRLFATILDLLVIFCAVWLAEGSFASQSLPTFLRLAPWMTLGFCLYVLTFWLTFGTTIGKFLMGIQIVDAQTGHPPSGRQLVRRLAGYAVSALPANLGFLWITIDPDQRGWHDRLGGTQVIRLRESVRRTT